MRKSICLFAAVFASMAFGPCGFAEVIHIPVGQQAPELSDLPRPTRGMSQDNVREAYGAPLSMLEPVGKPPISKWIYPQFTVYFESGIVIHSVLKHTAKFPQQITND